MRIRQWHIYSMLVPLSTILCILVFNQLCMSNAHIDCLFDGTVTTSTQADITNYITHTYQHTSSTQIIRQLHKQFPTIAHIAITYLPNSTITYDIESRQPLCVINNTQVLMHDGMLVPHEQVVAYITTVLPHITVMQKEQAPNTEYADSLLQSFDVDQCVGAQLSNSTFTVVAAEDLLKFAKRVPRAVHNAYAVVWHNKQNIELYDKQHVGVLVRCAADTQFDEQFFAVNKQARAQAKQKKCCIDRRFAKQVIVKNGRG